MGVRIDSLLTIKATTTTAPAVAKAAANQPASKTDNQVADGKPTDFSKALAKAQPKKKPDEPAQKSLDGASKPVSVTGKVAKKQAKKARDGQADDVQDADANDASTSQPVQTKDGTEVEDGSAVTGAVEGQIEDDDAATKKAKTFSSQTPDGQTPALIDPAQVQIAAVAVAPPPPQPSAELGGEATDGASVEAPAPAARNKSADAPVSRPVQDADPQALVPQATPGQAITGQSKTSDAKHGSPAIHDQALPGQAKPDEAAGTAFRKDAKGPEQVQSDARTPDQSADPKVAARPLADQAQSDLGDDGQTPEPEVQARQKDGQATAQQMATPATEFAEAFRELTEGASDGGGDKPAEKAVSPADMAIAAAASDHAAPKAVEAPRVQPAPTPVAPEVRFAEDNHPKVVTAVKTQMLPGGGAIQLRLDPPDLGPLRLEVRMEDGAMSASFVTANEQATSLLTHSLGQLKHALEGAGISVDKLQVRQGSHEQFSENSDQRQQGAPGDQSSARQEQQRREMLNRMWKKVAGGDPLDLVA